MKKIKTVNGIKTIDDWANDLVPIQLREILQEHRNTLIDKIMSGLELYVISKLNHKATKGQLERMKLRLFNLKHTGIDMDNYSSVLELVMQREQVNLDSGIFYIEIDNVLRNEIKGLPMPTRPGETVRFTNTDFVRFIRRDLVCNIQTSSGLRKHIKDTYGVANIDEVKLQYLLLELSDYFKNDSQDYSWLLQKLDESRYVDPELGNKIILNEELGAILDKHFDNVRV
jgi:hypothetical protein